MNSEFERGLTKLTQQDEFKQQVELKDQLNAERSNYEREEMREKYSTLDALVRAEFARKDEAIRTLHNILETQIRAVQTNIKQEEHNRYIFENEMRGEFLKYQENLRKELDGHKLQVSNTTDKLSEMIKIEIDTRLTSDM